MTKDEMALLKTEQFPSTELNINELPKGYEGTLLYGFTCDRNTMHVYAKAGEIHSVIYNNIGEIIRYTHDEELYAGHCIPDKRAYRQHTHYFFVSLLIKKGMNVAITEANEDHEDLKIGEFVAHAKLAEDLKTIKSLA